MVSHFHHRKILPLSQSCCFIHFRHYHFVCQIWVDISLNRVLNDDMVWAKLNNLNVSHQAVESKNIFIVILQQVCESEENYISSSPRSILTKTPKIDLCWNIQNLHSVQNVIQTSYYYFINYWSVYLLPLFCSTYTRSINSVFSLFKFIPGSQRLLSMSDYTISLVNLTALHWPLLFSTLITTCLPLLHHPTTKLKIYKSPWRPCACTSPSPLYWPYLPPRS